jgi:hypothetical protein
MRAQKRANSAASAESVLLRKSSPCAKPLTRAGVDHGHDPAGIDQRGGAGLAVGAGGLHANAASKGGDTAPHQPLVQLAAARSIIGEHPLLELAAGVQQCHVELALGDVDADPKLNQAIHRPDLPRMRARGHQAAPRPSYRSVS